MFKELYEQKIPSTNEPSTPIPTGTSQEEYTDKAIKEFIEQIQERAPF